MARAMQTGNARADERVKVVAEIVAWLRDSHDGKLVSRTYLADHIEAKFADNNGSAAAQAISPMIWDEAGTINKEAWDYLEAKAKERGR